MLPFALLVGLLTLAASTRSVVTKFAVPQHPSPTAVHSASSVVSPNSDPPTPPSSWTVEAPTEVERQPLLAPWLRRAPQSSRQTTRSSSPGGSKAALVKYSLFAWTSPAVFVITSVTLDKTNTIFIGYGDKICWISNGKALLVVLGVPVALILLFNCVALSLTLVSIWKVQKSTRRVTDQGQQTSLPLLYVKLSSTFGFTWLLGFIVPFAKLEFLDYLFVILNSLQGFFIFLAFVANKRSLKKMKSLWMSRARSNSASTHSGNNKTRVTRV